MIFWSSFIKKIKQSISKEDFNKLTGRVDTNTTNITANLEKINLISTELANANLVNYTGPYSASKTYKVGQAITFIKSPEVKAKWYVSNKDRNKGNTPAGVSDEFWELISEPSINLNDYLNKNEAAAMYLSKSEANTVYLSKSDAAVQYSTKSELNNYYTKSESDNRFANINNSYSKFESDEKYAQKDSVYPKFEVYTKSETYNRAEINRKVLKNKRLNWYSNGYSIKSGKERLSGYALYGYLANIGVNLGLIQNVVFRNNTSDWLGFSWNINVYENRLDIYIYRMFDDDRTEITNRNFEFDIYYYEQ